MNTSSVKSTAMILFPLLMAPLIEQVSANNQFILDDFSAFESRLHNLEIQSDDLVHSEKPVFEI